MDVISLDIEATGLDVEHGCLIYFVTITDAEETLYWEWDVNPLTRKPRVLLSDIREIRARVARADLVVLQNGKFDLKFLFHQGILQEKDWDWSKVRDTIFGGHILASNQPLDLTTMSAVYAGVDIKPFEVAIKTACAEARRYASANYPNWRIAKAGIEELPSAKGSIWAADMWLPRAIATKEYYPEDHPWWTVLADYANADSQCTRMIYNRQQELIEAQGTQAIYQERLKLVKVVCRMERTGMTLSKSKLNELRDDYKIESNRALFKCSEIAESYGYDLVMPKGATNKSLTNFVFGYDEFHEDGSFKRRFDGLNLPTVKVTKSKKTSNPSLDKAALDIYEEVLPDGPAKDFVIALRGKRKRDTAISYMDSYEGFWLPTTDEDWYRLYSSLNPTATATLRFSSSHPNQQNISKQEGFNLRYMFGPAPGREWWSLDYENIELRIPAYESNERVMIELFEKPDEPPYFGSYHLMNASIIYPDLFWPIAEQKGEFKKRYGATWYQWCKNFGFAVSYGAMPESGTADRAAHKSGAQRMVMDKLSEHSKLNAKMIAHANKYGFVRTMPDKTVDPRKGYPVVCTQSAWGKISPTIPLNYHVQSTAMWCTAKAMGRCYEYLDELNNYETDIPTIQRSGYFMTAQVHDEIVFDFPAGRGPKPWLTNLPKIRKIKKLMEQSGDDIGVPLKAAITYNPVNWSDGVSL